MAEGLGEGVKNAEKMIKIIYSCGVSHSNQQQDRRRRARRAHALFRPQRRDYTLSARQVKYSDGSLHMLLTSY